MHDPDCNDPNCPGIDLPAAPKVELVTSCGHTLDIPPEHMMKLLDFVTLGTLGVIEPVMPCPDCGVEQVMTPAKIVFHTQDLAAVNRARGITPLDKPIPPVHNPRHN